MQYTTLSVLRANPCRDEATCEPFMPKRKFFGDKVCVVEEWLRKNSTLCIKGKNLSQADYFERNMKHDDPTMRFFRYLCGYAGTGKTTFLHWFFEKRCPNKYNYCIIDFFKSRSSQDAEDLVKHIANILRDTLSVFYPSDIIRKLRY